MDKHLKNKYERELNFRDPVYGTNLIDYKSSKYEITNNEELLKQIKKSTNVMKFLDKEMKTTEKENNNMKYWRSTDLYIGIGTGSANMNNNENIILKNIIGKQNVNVIFIDPNYNNNTIRIIKIIELLHSHGIIIDMVYGNYMIDIALYFSQTTNQIVDIGDIESPYLTKLVCSNSNINIYICSVGLYSNYVNSETYETYEYTEKCIYPVINMNTDIESEINNLWTEFHKLLENGDCIYIDCELWININEIDNNKKMLVHRRHGSSFEYICELGYILHILHKNNKCIKVYKRDYFLDWTPKSTSEIYTDKNILHNNQYLDTTNKNKLFI